MRALLLGCLATVVFASHAVAQLPEATGREVVLERPCCKLFVPAGYEPRDDGAVDLLVHFHGHPPVVRNNAEYAGLNAVILTVNFNGLSKAYSVPFSDRELFGKILDEALAALQQEEGFDERAHWDKICLSSFSAGYGAVREILKESAYRDQMAGILAADSLYASTAADGTPDDAQLADYKAWADQAVAGEKTFLFSYSCVPTDGYENTRETGEEILAHLDLTAEKVDERGLGDLVFDRTASQGEFRLWGTPGTDANAHMAHLRFIGEYFQHLPLAKRGSPTSDK